MRQLFAFAFFVVVSTHAAIAADTEAAQPPWLAAQSLLNKASADISTGGIVALAPYVPDLQKALESAVPVMQPVDQGNGESVVLTDGMMETIMALGEASKDDPKKHIVALPTPYIKISLFLGSYYNETRDPAAAIVALDRGIALSDIAGLGFGEQDSYLLSEKGAALEALKRFDESLSTYDKGLALPVLTDQDRARLYRGRGYSLTELGRLDDAEKAYKDSLVCEPNNARALNELKYIAQVRAGRPPVAGTIQTVQPAQSPDARSDQCGKT
jgi:tetratricopeptide (TPR) repeat protein